MSLLWVLICFLLTFILVFIQKNNDAVSPVIGTILMVAIAVILAALIAAYSFGLFSEQKIAPQASIRIMSADTSANTLTLEHQGGSDLILSYVKVIVEQGNNRLSFDNAGDSSDRFVAGDKLKINLTSPNVILLNDNPTGLSIPPAGFSLQNGIEIKVTLIDVPSAQKISDLKIRT